MDAVLRALIHSTKTPPSPETIWSAVSWADSVQEWASRPEVGIGDDDTLSFEWQRGGKHLHVMFQKRDVEAYFAEDDGDQWETTLPAGAEKLVSALSSFAV